MGFHQWYLQIRVNHPIDGVTPDIFTTLRGLSAGAGGEIQLADAINIHAKQGEVETVRLKGRRFDCGSVDGFLDAIMHQAKRREG